VFWLRVQRYGFFSNLQIISASFSQIK